MTHAPSPAEPGCLAQQLGFAHIARVVDVFYDRIQAHPTLSAPFGTVKDWPHHKAKITHFWWVTLGGEPYLTLAYNVPMKHLEAGFSDLLLADWLALFHQVQLELLALELATAWQELATGMGRNLARMNAALAARVGQGA